MQKCIYCGLLNEDPTEICKSCGFTEFEEKPRLVVSRQPEKKTRTLLSSLPAESKGAMVTLKCRTPAEAYLVLENLGSPDVVALLPDEEEMPLQWRKNGYVEVQVPAGAYNSNGELRSIVEFSTNPPADPKPGDEGLAPIEKLFAALLGSVCMVPGLLIFLWLLASYTDKREERKARELKFWLFVGVGGTISVFLLGYFFM